ncbi:hypothetical protein [Dyella sp.]|uniref:hypothetical protein n=1 Tax=Dyella sp. TaxID=1869338 RepID=UPI002ED3F9CC
MRPLAGVLALVACAWAVQATDKPAADETGVMVYGKPDGDVPGWAINTIAPAGWTADCCQYARAIGVNLVIYRGDWTGEPDRVMVLNVWPRKLPTLQAEWDADRKKYLERDPAAKVEPFPIKANPQSGVSCSGGLYHGSDHVDDVVVFCDPGKTTGIRLSWSMTLSTPGGDRDQVLALFRKVVEQSFYMKYKDSRDNHGSAKGGARH